MENKEQEYRICLAHVVKFIMNSNEGQTWQPLNAEYANGIAEMCQRVLDGETTEQAIENIKG